MKRIIEISLLISISLMLTTCSNEQDTDEEKNECCHDYEKPTDLKHIDWENYNDVSTVFWTYASRDCNADRLYEDTAKYIKVSGWLHRGYGLNNSKHLRLVDSEADILLYDHPNPIVHFVVAGGSDVEDSIRAKIAAADITQKWYVRGKISFSERSNSNICSYYLLHITINSADDVYFE